MEADDKATDGINSLLTMVQGLFRKERLLSVIKDFVFFPDSSKNEKKVVCRYPQFFATHSSTISVCTPNSKKVAMEKEELTSGQRVVARVSRCCSLPVR